MTESRLFVALDQRISVQEGTGQNNYKGLGETLGDYEYVLCSDGFTCVCVCVCVYIHIYIYLYIYFYDKFCNSSSQDGKLVGS